MFTGESPINYEQKCLCVLVLDTSTSMLGKPIKQLIEGVKSLKEELLNDPTAVERVEIAVVTFNSKAQCIQQPINPYDFRPPHLIAAGMTELVKGVEKGIAVIEERKQFYKETGQNYYRPWMILITDGEPTGPESIKALSLELQISYEKKKYIFYGIGVQGYKHDVLAEICPNEVPPLPLKGLSFKEFFKWLSNSLAIVSSAPEEDYGVFPPTSEWTNMTI